MAYPWVKLWTEFIHDPKVGMLSEHLQLMFVKLMCVTGEHDATRGGALPSVEETAWTLHIAENDLLADLVALERVGMVVCKDGVWYVTNFERFAMPTYSHDTGFPAVFRGIPKIWTDAELLAADPDTLTPEWIPSSSIPNGLCGVYMLEMDGLDKKYIGASINIRKRIVQHLQAIYDSVHPMSDDVWALRPAPLKVQILEVTEPELLSDREAYYIAKYGLANLYNTRPSGVHAAWHN